MSITTFLYSAYAAFAIAVSYLVIKLPHSYRIRYVAIPAVIAFGVLVFLYAPTLLGTPRFAYPSSKFALLETRVFTRDGEKVIEIWVIEDGAKDSSLWEFPYDDETRKGLQKLQQQGQQGQRGARGKFTKQGHGDRASNHGNYDVPGLDLFDPPIEQLPQKGMTE